jgi:pimeloyl-ACP methyl ester carboxylesterase
MVRLTSALLAVAAASACILAPAPATDRKPADKPSARGVEGSWMGTLKVTGTGVELRLGIKITKKPDGTLTGTLDSIDQGAKDLPLGTVTFKDDTLQFTLKGVPASYEGKLNKDHTEISGTWKQSGSLPLTFKRVDKAVTLHRPQEPKKPYPYRTEEVGYENTKAGAKFAGTLTLPRGNGPFPAVLFITGSGPQDRDETVFSHKPFLVIADYLTRRGIATLRVDDRGVGGSKGGDLKGATTEDFAGDVEAGVEYLKGRKEINRHQIGLIGHSEGGVIAPMVAARSKDVAFIVLLAGTGLPGDEVMALQVAHVLKSMGADDAKIAQAVATEKRVVEVAKAEKDSAEAEKKIRTLLRGELDKLSDKEKKELAEGQGMEAAKAAVDTQVKLASSPWFRYFLMYDPRPALKKVYCPVLAVNGEKDVQVAPKENLAAIAGALKAGGNKDHTVKELPGLNHLFQTCKTGAVSEYGKIEETVAPAALQVIGDWIVKRTTADSSTR